MDTASNKAHNKKLTAAMFAAILLFCVLYMVTAAKYSDKCIGSACQIEVAGKVNPNTASVAELVRITGIGEKTAQEIVSYRESSDKPVVFESVKELDNVKGIGPGTIKKIEPYIRFE